MQHLVYFFLFLSSSIFSQEIIEPIFIKKSSLQVETLVAVDNFNTQYYINNNIFNKANTNKTITYNNLQLGNLESANPFNPLKINLFYKDFNTVIILDNRLAEIFKIDFNTISDYKNVSHITTGYDNTIWIFNQDTQQLELYDYKTNSSRTQTLPIQTEVLDLKSNYNTCWLLTKKYLYVYNYFGSLLKKMENDGFTSLAESNQNIVLKKDNTLYYLKKNTGNPIPISTPNLLIKQFFVINETLYIYDNETIYKYKIKTI
ncbi:hypothetical protein [Thalassobellus suaedae]|uniref:Uncharacterized protein n=1 Tax=Thalassobellus suaedae TaxID=3074124 RepID=A0ABY9XYQ6_9FLAO|nr:hypothetical protein RHP49_09245 [Flavobacteriaceae bacterium HL-DH10]